MICFGFIYTQFVNIFYDIYTQLLIGMTGSSDPVVPVYKSLGLNVFGAFLYLIIAVQLALMYFQFLTRGFEMLILRLGIFKYSITKNRDFFDESLKLAELIDIKNNPLRFPYRSGFFKGGEEL